MCVNDLTKVVLDSAAAGIEPTISNHQIKILTSTPMRHNHAQYIQLLSYLGNGFVPRDY